MKNKKNWLIGSLLLLAVLAFITVGYVLYSNQEKKTGINEQKEDLSVFTKDNDADLATFDFPENLLTDTEIQTNYQNLEKKVDTFTFEYSCTDYTKGVIAIQNDKEISEDACFKENITVDHLFTYQTQTKYACLSCSTTGTQVYKTNNYYIILDYKADIAQASLIIYDLNGTELLTDTDLREQIYDEENSDEATNTKPVIINNILYYVKVINNNSNQISLTQVNLTDKKLESKSINTYTKYFGQL